MTVYEQFKFNATTLSFQCDSWRFLSANCDIKGAAKAPLFQVFAKERKETLYPKSTEGVKEIINVYHSR